MCASMIPGKCEERELQKRAKDTGALLLWTWNESYKSATKLAEDICDEMGTYEWLDDDTHWIWDVAMDLYIDTYGDPI
jgi:hypothetical protein